jgi:hypothetical protein
VVPLAGLCALATGAKTMPYDYQCRLERRFRPPGTIEYSRLTPTLSLLSDTLTMTSNPIGPFRHGTDWTIAHNGGMPSIESSAVAPSPAVRQHLVLTL